MREIVKTEYDLPPDTKLEDIPAAVLVDGELSSILALAEAAGLDLDMFTSDLKIRQMVEAELESETKTAPVHNTRSTVAPPEVLESLTGLTNQQLKKLYNVVIGKFGARCSGQQQFLDLCKFFKNGKRFINYAYHKEGKNKELWTAANQELGGLLLLKNTLQKNTLQKKHENGTASQYLHFPPGQAEKFAHGLNLLIRAAASYATPEVLKRGYDLGFVGDIMRGNYRKVLETMDVGWETRDAKYKNFLATEAVPRVMTAMLKHEGQCPEAEFTE
jgi:hypothetical protein